MAINGLFLTVHFRTNLARTLTRNTHAVCERAHIACDVLAIIGPCSHSLRMTPSSVAARGFDRSSAKRPFPRQPVEPSRAHSQPGCSAANVSTGR